MVMSADRRGWIRDEQIARAVGASALVFGALAVATPRALARAFGIRSPAREFVYMLRFAGVANAGLGFNLVTAPDEASRKRLLVLGALLDGANALLAARAGMSRRTTTMLVVGNGIVAMVAVTPTVKNLRGQR